MFADRRQQMLESMGPDAVAIFVGGRLAVRSADTEYPFRQDSDFWYLTGFDHPDAIAVLSTREGPDFTLFVQPRDRDAETWTGYRPGIDGAVSDYDADEAHPIDEFTGKLPELLRGAARIYHVLGRDTAIDAKIVALQEEIRRQSRGGTRRRDASASIAAASAASRARADGTVAGRVARVLPQRATQDRVERAHLLAHGVEGDGQERQGAPRRLRAHDGPVATHAVGVGAGVVQPAAARAWHVRQIGRRPYGALIAQLVHRQRPPRRLAGLRPERNDGGF